MVLLHPETASLRPLMGGEDGFGRDSSHLVLTEPSATRGLLSPRQGEIMDLVSAGLTNKDIANRLGLTSGTVKQHLAAIFRKLGVSNRTWAVAMWREAAPANGAMTGQGVAQGTGLANGPTTGTATGIATGFANASSHTAKGALPAHAFARAGSIARSAPGNALPFHLDTGIAALPRRVLAAVSVDLSGDAQSGEIAAEDAARVIATCRNWAGIFEGDLHLLPSGCALVVFGYPLSHIDDIERAHAFGTAVRDELGRTLGLAARIGVDAALDRPLAERGQVLSSAAIRGSFEAMQSCQPGEIAISERAATIDRPQDRLATLLGQAPFAAALTDRTETPGPRWFTVEAWPLLSGKLVLDAWAQSPLAKGNRTIVLRLPSRTVPSLAIESALVRQLTVQASEFGRPAYPGAGLGWWLRQLAEEGPVTVLLHGWREDITLPALLGEPALEELEGLPLTLVAGPVPVRGAPRLSIRPLAAQGRVPLVSRVHELPLPDAADLMPGYGPDLVSLLDPLDDLAKGVLCLLLRHRRCTPQFLASQLESPLAPLEQRVERLHRLGLVAMWPDRSIRLRDARTEDVVGEQVSPITRVIYP